MSHSSDIVHDTLFVDGADMPPHRLPRHTAPRAAKFQSSPSTNLVAELSRRQRRRTAFVFEVSLENPNGSVG